MIFPVRHRIQRERLLALQVIVSGALPSFVPFILETIAEIERTERSASDIRRKAIRSSRRAA